MRAALWLLAALALALLAGCGGPETTTSDAGADAGCPNDLPASCPTPAPGYAADVAPILEEKCVPCHSPGGQNASVRLDSYDAVHARRSAVLTQVYGCRMPLAGAAPLTSDERGVILAWLVCGAPDD